MLPNVAQPNAFRYDVRGRKRQHARCHERRADQPNGKQGLRVRPGERLQCTRGIRCRVDLDARGMQGLRIGHTLMKNATRSAKIAEITTSERVSRNSRRWR
jgi:hypothetical protein